MKDYKLLGFEKSKRKGKMYTAILENKKTGKLITSLHFGASNCENYQDRTGLNAYPKLIHGDTKRRKNYRARHKNTLKSGYYSPGYFSYYYLW